MIEVSIQSLFYQIPLWGGQSRGLPPPFFKAGVSILLPPYILKIGDYNRYIQEILIYNMYCSSDN